MFELHTNITHFLAATDQSVLAICAQIPTTHTAKHMLSQRSYKHTAASPAESVCVFLTSVRALGRTDTAAPCAQTQASRVAPMDPPAEPETHTDREREI